MREKHWRRCIFNVSCGIQTVTGSYLTMHAAYMDGSRLGSRCCKHRIISKGTRHEPVSLLFSFLSPFPLPVLLILYSS